jgi:hypothetical protein
MARFNDQFTEWYATDQDGHLAAFFTDTKVLPAALSALSDEEFDAMGDGLERLSRSNGALQGRGTPTEGLWELGFFTYTLFGPKEDPSTGNGPYQVERKPEVPLFVIEIEESLLKSLRLFKFRTVCFAKERTITAQMFGNEGIPLLRDP